MLDRWAKRKRERMKQSDDSSSIVRVTRRPWSAGEWYDKDINGTALFHFLGAYEMQCPRCFFSRSIWQDGLENLPSFFCSSWPTPVYKDRSNIHRPAQTYQEYQSTRSSRLELTAKERKTDFLVKMAPKLSVRYLKFSWELFTPSVI